MNNKVFNHSLTILKKYISENMVVGTGGFTSSSPAEGPVAGYDKPIMPVLKRKPIKSPKDLNISRKEK